MSFDVFAESRLRHVLTAQNFPCGSLAGGISEGTYFTSLPGT